MKTPGIVPYISSDILGEFAYQSVNSKPEAPWIKRIGTGVKFTEEIEKSNNDDSSTSSLVNKNDTITLNEDSKKSISNQDFKPAKDLKSKSYEAFSNINM